MLDFFLYIISGVFIGIAASFVPGLFYSELSLLFFGFLSGINAAIFISSSAIAFSLFEFITTSIFEIGDDITSLSLDASIQTENLTRIAKTVSTGTIISLFFSLPLIFVFQNLFTQIHSTIQSSLLVILTAIILYTVISERTFARKIFASLIFILTGIFGIIVQDSGFLPSNLLLMPIFIGLFGFSSFARKHFEKTVAFPVSLSEKIRVSLLSFGATLFAILVPSMKRSHTSAIVMGMGKLGQSETILLALSIISTSFLIISIIALSSNSIRSILAYDVSEITELNFNQILLILGSFIIAATFSIILLLCSVKHLQNIISKINKKYLKIFGLLCGIALILYFTSWKGILLAFTATLIGILAIKLEVRSSHLMGILLVPVLLRLAGV
jgi:putative membrane protein